jgi:hypothetical protein
MTLLVSDVILRARQAADLENSTFISDAELLGAVNVQAAELHGLKTTLYEDYDTTYSTIVVASGNSLSLPTDFFKLRRLEFLVNSRSTRL